jgi:predicted SAM-dependent methyltransferase
MGIKINLGCGPNKLKGFVNCDWSKEMGADKVFDMNKIPWPFKDNSVSEVLMSHVLEHFHEPIKILKEIYRISQNGARIRINVPYFSHESSFSMLDHYHHFTWTSFDALEKRHPCHWQSVGNFKIVKKKLRSRFLGEKTIFNLFPRLYQEYLCWIFPVQGMYIELRVVK